MTDSNGHFVCYREKTFRPDALDEIRQANVVIEEYESQGMPMSLRQLYYQLVARGFIENTAKSYDRLGDLISDGRMAGLVSWTAIVDRNRNLMGLQTFKSPQDAVLWMAKEKYHLDMWADQPFRPEVWVEKAALEGVVGTICDELRVNFFSCRGYNSQSEQWRAGRRFADYASRGQRPIVFHLGDHDPSGIDMTRDNQERLSLFAGAPVQVVRLALNMSQVEELRPPPNPAKITDPRAADYISKYGHESWEVDALDPAYLHRLIRDAVMRLRDEKFWDAALKLEAEDRNELEIMGEEE